MKDCLFPKFLADSLVGEVWAEKVYRFAPQAQINGEACLVFAVPGQGHILLCKVLPVLLQGTGVDGFLLLPGAPAAYRA